MNMEKLAKAVAERSGYRQSDIRDLLWQTFDVLAQSLAKGEDVTLSNFGKFKTYERAAAVGRDIRTQEPIQVPAQQVVRFTATGRLKEMVRDGDAMNTIRKPATGRAARKKTD